MQSYSIEEIVEALKAGDLVALPTETVYGLAANALNPHAAQKIFQVKGRPFIDPLIVHTLDVDSALQLTYFSELAFKLADKFWPGPLTLVLPKHPVVPNIVTAGLPSVAIRSPKHPIFREILSASKLPLAAPSANPFGYLSPTEAHHVKKTLGSKIKYIVDGGPCSIGLESTILNLLDPDYPEILRPGPISAEDLQFVFGFKPPYISTSAQEGAQVSPGLLKSHYSPKTYLHTFIANTIPDFSALEGKSAIIFVKRPQNLNENKNLNLFWLSEDGDLNEVSKNLFSLLERLDSQLFNSIFIELCEKKGIGIAINDRLQRAAHK